MGSPPRPLMADVAARAGVSVMTVSRVLSGFPGVADPTRRRVEDAVVALGYHANTAARVLAGGRSRTLGVIAVETEQFGPSHMLFGIEAAARATGHLLSFVTLSRSGKDMASTLEHLRASHVEGVIVVAPVRRGGRCGGHPRGPGTPGRRGRRSPHQCGDGDDRPARGSPHRDAAPAATRAPDGPPCAGSAELDRRHIEDAGLDRSPAVPRRHARDRAGG